MKGITQPCSNCRQILIRFANLKGKGTFEVKCPHCQTTQEVAFGNKMNIIIKIIVVVLIVVAFMAVGTRKSNIVDDRIYAG